MATGCVLRPELGEAIIQAFSRETFPSKEIFFWRRVAAAQYGSWIVLDPQNSSLRVPGVLGKTQLFPFDGKTGWKLKRYLMPKKINQSKCVSHL